MRIGAIIPSHNRKEQLLGLLGQLYSQELPAGVGLAVIPVIDGGTDGSADAVRRIYPDAHVIEGNGSWWFTRCLNRGCEKARELGCEMVLTLNDDCSIPARLVATLLSAYRSVPGCGAMCAVTVIRSHNYRVTFSGAPEFSRLKVRFRPYIDNRREFERLDLSGIYPTCSVMTRGLLFSMAAGEEVGFFDASAFPQYGSDEDFGLRLIRKGYKLFVCHDAQVVDDPHLTSKGSAITKPTVGSVLRSFFNKYSVNSLQKAFRFQLRHGYPPVAPLNLAVYVAGTLYASLWKYRKTKLA